MRHAVLIAANLLVATAAVAQDAPVLEAFTDGIVEERNIRVDSTTLNGDAPVIWTDEINLLDANYIRLFLRVEGEGFAPDAFLRLAAPLDQTIDIPLASLSVEGDWSPLLPNGRVRLALVSSEPPGDTALLIEKIAIQSEKGSLFSFWGGVNELKPVNDAEVPALIRDKRLPIGFLSFIENGVAATCTGFLVGFDLLMTNQHCINSDETCRTMTAVFGYEFDIEKNRLVMGKQTRCANYDPAFTDFGLDASLVRLTAAPGPEYGQIDLTSSVPATEGPLFIIQHAGSSPKQVSFINCNLLVHNVAGRTENTDFTHTCDTAGGSSGSPIFDVQGQLVGLHHFGFKEDPAGTWTENRGVHFTYIADWVSSLPVSP